MSEVHLLKGTSAAEKPSQKFLFKERALAVCLDTDTSACA